MQRAANHRLECMRVTNKGLCVKRWRKGDASLSSYLHFETMLRWFRAKLWTTLGRSRPPQLQKNVKLARPHK